LIAPLAISDARRWKNENTSRCAVREFLYGSQKSELGDSLVKVLFWKEQSSKKFGAVAELVGIEGGVVSGVFNLESSGVEASDWRPRHDEQYHEV
jgi:hypothetical protein